MKKNLIGKILIGFSLVLIVFGIYNYINAPKEVYDDDVVEKILTQKEAEKVIKDKVNNALNLYENPEDYYKVIEENDTSIKVSNYEEVLKKTFTNNGIKEIENLAIGDNKYITKDNNSIYVLKDIPKSKLHINETITMKDYKLYRSKMTVNLSFENNYMDDTGTLNINVTTLEVILIKENNNWLIDSLNPNYL